jgi:hypothetical protein
MARGPENTRQHYNASSWKVGHDSLGEIFVAYALRWQGDRCQCEIRRSSRDEPIEQPRGAVETGQKD